MKNENLSKQDESKTYNLMLNKALVEIVRRLGVAGKDSWFSSISKLIKNKGYSLLFFIGEEEENRPFSDKEIDRMISLASVDKRHYNSLIRRIEISSRPDTQNVSVNLNIEFHSLLKRFCKYNHFFISSLVNALIFERIVEYARLFTDRDLKTLEDLISFIDNEYTDEVEEREKDFRKLSFGEWEIKYRYPGSYSRFK